MITTALRVPYSYKTPIKIKPLFDAHCGNAAFDKKGFKQFIERDDDDDTYFIGGGDLMDSVITTDMKRYQKSIDASPHDEIIDDQVSDMRRILEPYKARILGMHTGNHEDVIARKCGTHPMKRLCSELGVPYMGYSSLFSLTLDDRGGSNRHAKIVFRVHHGWGGGSRTRGGSITKYEKDMGKWDADIYMYGHDHKKQIDRIPRLGLQKDRLVARPQLLVLCGSFLKTFLDTSDSTYSERSGYPPTEIGSPVIYITPGVRDGYEVRADI